MTDNKRNSMAGKVATPKTAGTPASSGSGSQPMPDTLEALGKSIGARIKLTTAAPHSQTYEGSLFTACPILNIVAINTRTPEPNASSNAAAQSGDYHIIPVSRIQTFQVLSLAPEADKTTFATAQPAIGPVDLKRLEKREQIRVEQLKEYERTRNKGVTKEAQAIFDAFKKINMQTDWHGNDLKSIRVQGAILIVPPYRPEDVKKMNATPELATRVKKIVESAQRQFREKEEQERKTAAQAGPRKGG